MLKPDFAFLHTALHEKWRSQGVRGAVYAEPEAIACRIELKTRLNPAGDTLCAEARAFFPAESEIACGDRIRFDKRLFQVSSVEKIYALSGKISHLEAELK